MKALEREVRSIEATNPKLLETEMYAPQRNKLPLLKQEYEELKAERDSIIGRWQTSEPKGKTVTIDGKQYKEGDIIVKNGKKFRVRITQ